ncbi:MAG TPA: LemA family protein [Gemmatimonadaceae bacterium]|nr:LemA family protein [Gemmatimonadaceae bacterium]
MRRILGLAGLVLTATTGCGYNTIQTLDEQAGAAKQQIEVQLQRRADLVGNLVETVKGQARQELEVFTEVTRARAGLTSAIQRGDPGEMANADAQMSGALRSLMINVEAYPQLKSDQAFLRLQDELAGTENRIAVSRTDYNDAVRQYNTYIRRFPTVLTAKVVGARPREYFEVTDPSARQAPKVDFGTPKKDS